MHGWRGKEGATWLYRYFSRTGRLLYVGVSDRPLNRYRETKKGHFGTRIDTVTLREYPTRRGALMAEKRAIKYENPLYNILHSGHPERRAVGACRA